MSRTPLRLPVRLRPALAGRVSSLVLALAGVASAQVAAPPGAKPAAPDTRPLARYVPAEKLVLYAGSEGLLNHTAAWEKTAAHKLLTETKLGEMLEALGAQLAETRLAAVSGRKASGTDLVAALKHAAKNGYLVAVGTAAAEGGKPAQDFALVVLRGAAGRDVIGPFSRVIGTLMGASKPTLAKKGTRNVVSVAGTANGKGWVWWVEGPDLVLGSAGTEDVVAAVLDGQRKNAVDRPELQALAKADGAFEPLGVLRFDARNGVPAVPFKSRLEQVAAQGLRDLDFRWGFENEAIMTVARIDAPKPRQGLLALFDQPTFERSQAPPVPEGVHGFTALALDTSKLLDTVLGAMPASEAKSAVDSTLDELKTRSRIELRKDLLSKLGPRMVAYIMPGGTPVPRPAGGEAGAGAQAPASAPAPGGPLAGFLSGTPLNPAVLSSYSGAQAPRLTLVADVADPVAVGKALDNLMVAVNQELKQRAAEAAAAAEAAHPDQGEGAQPGGAQTKGTTKGSRREKTDVPAIAFTLMPGKDKTYVLTVPSSMSKSFPPGFRPTVRLGPKHLAISMAPDAARLALEAKPGEWTPPAEISATIDALPKNLLVLSVDDPRPTAPDLLAALPKVIQSSVNAAVLSAQSRASAAASGPAPAGGEAPGPEGGGGKRAGLSVSGPGGYSAPMPGGAPGATSPAYPSSMMGGGYPSPTPTGGLEGSGGPGGPGGPGGEAGPGLVRLQVDPAKLPKADEIRSRMFPSTTYVQADDGKVTIVTRASFPNVVPVASAVGVAVALPAIEAARTGNPAPGAEGAPGGPGAAENSGGPGAPESSGGPPAATPEAVSRPGGRARDR